jgi:hypothetical protein
MPRQSNAVSQILENNDRTLTRRQLHQKADKFVAEGIAATCLWDKSAESPLGDYHSVVFWARPAHNVGVTVQFWSLPGLPVLLQVSWRADHGPSRRFLPPDLPARMERSGFEERGPGKHERMFRIRSVRDVERVARLVIDILYGAFRDRGLFPLEVQVVFDGRASEDFVHTSFTPHELAQIAMSVGYAARVLPADDQGAAAAIMLRKGPVVGHVVLGDQLTPNLYASGFLGSPAVPAAQRGARTALRRAQPNLRPGAWRIGVALYFEGGVTAEWVGQQIVRGMNLIASSAKGSRGRSVSASFSQSAPATESDLYRSLLVSLGL